MEPMPALLGTLAASIEFPAPDDPNNPDSGFSLTAQQARKLAVLINSLIDYIKVEYARCSKTP